MNFDLLGSLEILAFFHSVVFWFGDLNFRIEGYDIHVVKSAIENDKLPLLWEKDQVREQKMSKRNVFNCIECTLVDS